jgi:hypothetical protein
MKGFAMNVSEIDGEKALCDHYEGSNLELKQTWFDMVELEIVAKV